MQTARVVPPAPTRSSVLGTAAAVLGATTVVALVDPHEGGRYPTCPLLALTGLSCPFCGGLRAVHDLTHLDLGGALERNPLVVLAAPLVVLAWLLWAQRAFTGRRLVVLPARVVPLLAPALLAVVVVFGVLRNLPGWTWLSPA